jgi:hypothetical protein
MSVVEGCDPIVALHGEPSWRAGGAPPYPRARAPRAGPASTRRQIARAWCPLSCSGHDLPYSIRSASAIQRASRRLMARARVFPWTPSSRAARGRGEHRRAAGAGHYRVDLAAAKQLEQSEEVLPEPFRVVGTSTHRKRSATSHGKQLVALAQLLDPVGRHPSAGREQAPERDCRGRRVPFDPPSPTLVSVHKRGGVAEDDKPSAGP